MKLSKIIRNASDVEILQLVDDSRVVSNKGLYFARKGFNVDGHDYINDAIANGAIAIVYSDPVEEKVAGIEYILVDDVIDVLHKACNIFFDYPSLKMRVHGITGTNGKTTTMKTLYNLMRKMGIRAAYVGTVSVEYDDTILPPTLSTPDILQLYTMYSEMSKAGITNICQEVSSQGLDLRRVEGIKFADASFTNLTQDHLDYHQSMDEYFGAKMKFFNQVGNDTPLIINCDDSYGKKIAAMDFPNIITYGTTEAADFYAKDIIIKENVSEFTLVYQGNSYYFKTNFSGMFNVYNMLNVIAILVVNGFEITSFIKYFETLKGVEGRLESIDEGQDFTVYIDYAHSPDSIKSVLNYLQSVKKEGARVISVLGSEGSRDALKRPLMGAMASRYSDHMIITNSDSRFERTKDIIAEIAAGAEDNNYEIITDRQAAITEAITLARKDDIVIILGRGHDPGMELNGVIYPYDGDHIYARNVLKGERYERKQIY